MHLRMKTILIGVSVTAAVGFAWEYSLAESIGPAALAARQHIKDNVLKAMADGQITRLERSDILAEAKEICNAQEYVGLVRTLNRFAGLHGTQSDSLSNVAIPQGLESDPSIMKQFVAQIPYVREPEIKLPPANKVIPRLGYVERPNAIVAHEADQLLAGLSRLGELNFKPPTLPQRMDKYVQAKKPKSSSTSTARVQTRNTIADKRTKEKTNLESYIKRPPSREHAKLQQPGRLWNDAGRPALAHSYSDYSVPVLNTPAGALLTSKLKSRTVKASFDQPVTPELSDKLIKQ